MGEFLLQEKCHKCPLDGEFIFSKMRERSDNNNLKEGWASRRQNKGHEMGVRGDRTDDSAIAADVTR